VMMLSGGLADFAGDGVPFRAMAKTSAKAFTCPSSLISTFH